MNSNFILIILGEPNTTFSELLFKYFKSKNFKKSKDTIVLIGNTMWSAVSILTNPALYPQNTVAPQIQAENTRVRTGIAINTYNTYVQCASTINPYFHNHHDW